jgi:catechol 2,3-dioxygenase-like lactoylglutathione lyase family enzyme
VIEFIGHERMEIAFRSILEGLEGWHSSAELRRGRWFFVAFSGSGGESGDHMLHKFRLANNLARHKYDRLFPGRSELLNLAPGEGDTVVLVDDFAGTGDQACDFWERTYRELLPFGARVVLVLVASSNKAVARIATATGMTPVAHIVLDETDDLFAEACGCFSVEEKVTLLQYCQRASTRKPRGHGECGFVIVLAHKCPNNSIAVLHVKARKWNGLFPRY